MTNEVVVPERSLRTQLARILLAWGMSHQHVEIVVDVMVGTDLCGVDSHGVGMLRSYHRMKEAGKLDPRPTIAVVREGPATALIDAGRSIGHVPTVMAMQMAVGKARDAGIAAVGVRNSNHFGAAGYYAEMAAEEGLLGMAFTNVTSSLVMPTHARRPYLGTNPIAFAAPTTGGQPFALDMATSTVASGKVTVAARLGREMPVGWVVDDEGLPLTDPALAPTGRRWLTALGGTPELGSHKGYGLGVMVEILASALNGQVAGDPAPGAPGDPPAAAEAVGHLVVAIEPDHFGGGDVLREQTQALTDRLRALPPVDPAEPVRIAGDRRTRTREQRSADGIPLSAALYEELRSVSEASGVPFDLRD